MQGASHRPARSTDESSNMARPSPFGRAMTVGRAITHDPTGSVDDNPQRVQTSS